MLCLLLLTACQRPSQDVALEAPVAFGQEYSRLEIPAASSLWVDSGRVFACTGGDGLYVVSTTDLHRPWLEDVVAVECHAVDGETGRVDIAAGEAGLAVLHPGNLSLIGTYATDYPLTALAVDAGNRQAWLGGRLADPTGGDDERIVVEGVVTYTLDHLEQNRWGELEPGELNGIAFHDGAVFVGRDDGTIDILGSGMDLRSTIDAGTIAGAAGGGLVAGADVLWIARGDDGLQGWDIADPDAPSLAGAWTDATAWGLARVDDRLYVGSDESLVVVDIRDPHAPAELGRVALDGMARPEGIYVLDTVAWVTDAEAGALAIVSVDEATIP